MNEHLHKMDDLFKKALDENEDIPSSSVWEEIDKKLDKNKVISISKKYYKLKWAAAVLLLLSFAMAMYTLYIRKENRLFVKNKNKLEKNAGNNKALNKIDSINSVTATKGPSSRTVKDSLILKLNQGINNNLSQKSFLKNTSIRKTIDPTIATTSKNLIILTKKSFAYKAAVNNDKQSSQKVQPNQQITVIHKTVPTNYSSINDIVDTTSSPSFRKNIADIFVLPSFIIDSTLTGFHTSISSLLNDNILMKQQLSGNEPLSSSKKTVIHKTPVSLLSVNVFYSPDVVSASVNNDHPHFIEEDKNEIKKSENIKYASTFGAVINYGSGKGWMVSSGVSYSIRISTIQPKTIYARPDNMGNYHYRLNCAAGYSYIPVNATMGMPGQGDSIVSQASQNTLSYIKIPLILKYVFVKNRWSIIPSAGLAVNFLSKGQIETNIPNPNGGKTPQLTAINGLKPAYYNGSISLALQYNIGKLIALSFEPTSRFALSSINKDAQVKTYYQSIGFASGIVIKL